MQGDTFAPYLFVIVLDCSRLFSIMQWGKPHKEKRTSLVLLFGGNGIVGFQQSVNWPWFCWWHCSSDEIRQARQLLRNVEVECGKVGLSLNAKKTKAVYLTVERKEMETIYGTKIELDLTLCSKERDVNVCEALA